MPSSRDREEQELMYMFYPYLLIPLIRAGLIKKEDESDPDRVRAIVVRRKKFAIKNAKLCVNLEFTFCKEAEKAWKKGNKEIAIVLLAVGIEQCLNAVLRIIIQAKGVKPAHITELIRSQNIDSKLTWLFEMYSGRHFPTALLKRSKKIFDIRNMLVHYKAVPGQIDLDVDSYSKVRKEIALLGRFQSGTFFYRFHEFCWTVICQCDPVMELAIKLREKIMPYDKIWTKGSGPFQ